MRNSKRYLSYSVFGVGLVGLAVVAGGEVEKTRTWGFDSDPVQKMAVGLTRMTGGWQVFADAGAPSGANVLAQISKSGRKAFNLVLVDGVKEVDVDLSVKFKAVMGEIDQGGGVVWRAKDRKNYYVARYNPLEENLRVYKIEKGKRSKLASKTVKYKEGWHTLHVTMKGKHVTCSLDGGKPLAVDDETFTTGGTIGLWTKADAMTYFDDLTLTRVRK